MTLREPTPIFTSRTSPIIEAPQGSGPGVTSEIQGWIKYRSMYEVTVNFRFIWNGDVKNTTTLDIVLPAQDGIAYYGGDFYYGSTFVDGDPHYESENTDEKDIQRKPFSVAGRGDYFQYEVSVDTGAYFEIYEIGFDIDTPRTPGYRLT